MTKFELARTAGRWRPRSRTYVALAILFVTAWPTNADVFHDAFAVRGPRIGAEGEVSSRRGHLRPLLLHSFLGGPCVGQALATEAIAECIRSGSVGEAESNIGLLCLVPTPAAADWDALVRWNVSISRKTLRKPPGGSASSTRCGKSRSCVRPTISRLRRVISPNPAECTTR